MNNHKNHKKYSEKDIIKRIDDLERRATVITLGRDISILHKKQNN
jgi:hypothetical protein